MQILCSEVPWLFLMTLRGVFFGVCLLHTLCHPSLAMQMDVVVLIYSVTSVAMVNAFSLAKTASVTDARLIPIVLAWRVVAAVLTNAKQIIIASEMFAGLILTAGDMAVAARLMIVRKRGSV